MSGGPLRSTVLRSDGGSFDHVADALDSTQENAPLSDAGCSHTVAAHRRGVPQGQSDVAAEAAAGNRPLAVRTLP
jgi:hypothetical protein